MWRRDTREKSRGYPANPAVSPRLRRMLPAALLAVPLLIMHRQQV